MERHKNKIHLVKAIHRPIRQPKRITAPNAQVAQHQEVPIPTSMSHIPDQAPSHPSTYPTAPLRISGQESPDQYLDSSMFADPHNLLDLSDFDFGFLDDYDTESLHFPTSSLAEIGDSDASLPLPPTPSQMIDSHGSQNPSSEEQCRELEFSPVLSFTPASRLPSPIQLRTRSPTNRGPPPPPYPRPRLPVLPQTEPSETPIPRSLHSDWSVSDYESMARSELQEDTTPQRQDGGLYSMERSVTDSQADALFSI